MASCSALYGEAPHRLLLTGGGARLRGLGPLLEGELGVPVAALGLPEAPWVTEGALPRESAAAALPACGVALGLALSVATPSPQVNFRKGDLSYRTDYAFLRERAPHLA